MIIPVFQKLHFTTALYDHSYLFISYTAKSDQYFRAGLQKYLVFLSIHKGTITLIGKTCYVSCRLWSANISYRRLKNYYMDKS